MKDNLKVQTEEAKELKNNCKKDAEVEGDHIVPVVGNE